MLGVFCQSVVHFSYPFLCIICCHEVRYDLVTGRLQALPGTSGDDFVHACGTREIVLPVVRV